MVFDDRDAIKVILENSTPDRNSKTTECSASLKQVTEETELLGKKVANILTILAGK